MYKFYKKNLILQKWEYIIKKCINECKSSFFINMVDFDVFKVTKKGIEDISDKFNKN